MWKQRQSARRPKVGYSELPVAPDRQGVTYTVTQLPSAELIVKRIQRFFSHFPPMNRVKTVLRKLLLACVRVNVIHLNQGYPGLINLQLINRTYRDFLIHTSKFRIIADNSYETKRYAVLESIGYSRRLNTMVKSSIFWDMNLHGLLCGELYLSFTFVTY
jgi:hypothetical protein